jgi:hypothetical protein
MLSTRNKQQETLLPSQWLLAAIERSRHSLSSTVGIPYSYISILIHLHAMMHHKAHGHTFELLVFYVAAQIAMGQDQR